MDKFKLFVLGESSGNPDKWSEYGWRAFALATTSDEALALFPEFAIASEVSVDGPMLVFVEPIPAINL